MSFRQSLVALVGVLVLVAVSCNILKKDDPNDAVWEFLVRFQDNLKQADDVILKQFDTKQSRESILAAIRIMQNKQENASDVSCRLLVQSAFITSYGDSVVVLIPYTFSTADSSDLSGDNSVVTVKLIKHPKRGFVIVKLDAEDFYREFQSVRADVAWRNQREEMLAPRRVHYARAQQLQKHYDSVVWYTTYKDRSYYYVVRGDWDEGYADPANRDDSKYSMGLVDENGVEIIPAEYELIGTLGFNEPNRVEVIAKDGGVGCFDLTTRKKIIHTNYSIIIPFKHGDVYALVRRLGDRTGYGWLDNDYTYHDNYPADSLEQWVKTFQYLPKELTLADGNQSICEIPNEEGAGNGFIMPPSCYVKSGLFSEVISGMTRKDMPWWGGSKDVVTASRIRFEQITDEISALITHVTSNYIESREGLYIKNQLTFTNADADTLVSTSLSGDYVMHMRRLDGNLIEVKQAHVWEYWYEGDDPDGPEVPTEFDRPIYAYFVLEGDKMRELESKRLFTFTEFVKIDSAYITGPFRYGDKNYNEQETAMLTLPSLQFMRKEILASYGYQFKDSVDIMRFGQFKQNVKDIDDLDFSEIDEHNMDFLDKVIALLTGKPKAI